MKKSITLSLVLAASMGLAACGEKAADDAATTETPATETVEAEISKITGGMGLGL